MLKLITNKWRSGLATVATIFSVLVLNSCDTMDDDALTNGPVVSVEDTEVYVMPDGTTYIDLLSKIKTNGEVTLNISSLPSKGTLTEVTTGFLRYKPHLNFKGTDHFAFAVLGSKSQVLAGDTVDIIVNDTLNLPCAIYPNDDWFHGDNGIHEIDVLKNDYICGDSTDVIIQIYKPSTDFPPYYGSVSVTSDNRIRYVPNGEATISDTIIYKVSRASNPSIFAFATLHININNECSPFLNDMNWTYDSKAVTYPHTDSAYLVLVDKHERCGRIYDEYTVTRSPSQNYLTYSAQGVYYHYTLESSSQVITDSIRYKICDGPDCLNGKFFIEIR